MEVVYTADPTPEDIEAVVANIASAAEKARPGANLTPFGFLLRDGAGTVVGGLTGRAIYDWMFVQFLSVPEAARGQGYGARLLAEAEAWGRARGLTGIWLDTFAFQAPAFYEKLGFERFGVIEDHPVGSRRLFYLKRFVPHSP